MKIIFIILLISTNILFSQNKTNNNIFKEYYSIQLDTTLKDLTFYNNNCIAHDDYEIICFDSTKNVIWNKSLNGSINSNVTIVEEKLIYIDSNYDLVCVDVNNGKIIQTLGLDIFHQAKISSFDFTGNKELLIPKETDSQKALLIIYDNGIIVCLDLETLQEYWRKSFNDFFISEPIFVKDKFLITSKSGFINYFDSQNGLLLWKWKEKEQFQINSNFVFTDNKAVILLNDEGYVYSINLLLGKLNWKVDKSKFSSILFFSNDGKSLFAQNINNNIVEINLLDGKFKNEIKSSYLNKNISYTFKFKGKIYFIIADKILSFEKNKLNISFKAKTNILHFIHNNSNKIILLNTDYKLIFIN
ncbi:MAG: PQQ-binding-like beta-propeller repeat protein [Melioribacteraceae bacterium]|nr:PQQ-binding-like beta-propeller repeat protein [Melioribacteraceae bacterium]